ncbi:MAG: hypothetical protein JSU86_15895 [Phycisphaerales bacterium]|nr:MAG: hypothetical protein JSU86_15895 [Phycisphaerales bacterium]
MRRIASLAAVVGLVGIHGPVRAGFDEAFDGHEIVAGQVAPVLPPPLRDFLEAHLEAVREHATAGPGPASTPGLLPGKADWHYVMLDIAADADDAAARRAAAEKFPRDRAAAAELFRKHGRRDGGLLPWIIVDRHHNLVEAFQAGETEAIVREAGVLLHFATDAALPFNTTADRDGTASGHLRRPSGMRSGTTLVHNTVRYRCQASLLRRLRSRLEYEVRVAPTRYGPIDNPIEAVFDVLLDAHRALHALLAIDAEIVADLGIRDAATFTAASDVYYDRLADRAAGIMESQLEAAVLLSAKLIGAAWAEAGSPSHDLWIAGKPARTDRSRSADTPAAPFVGSRHSTIFHQAACGHAKRIKATNRVYFNTAGEAQSAGRIPCKTCSPADR